MNQSNLSSILIAPNITTSTKPTIGVIPSIYFYFKMMATLFGTLTNTINILVFLSPKLNKDMNSYKFMLVNSCATVLYLSLAFSSAMFVSCTSCSTYGTYFAAFFTAYIGSGFCFNTLSYFRILVELTLSITTFYMLTNRSNWFIRASFRSVLISLLVISILIITHLLFNFTVAADLSKTTNSINITYYAYKTTDFGNGVGKDLSIVAILFRLTLAVIVLPIINILNVIEFRKRLNQKITKSVMINSLITRIIEQQAIGILYYNFTIY